LAREIIIVLPKTIPVLRDSKETVLKTNVQEFNIYFKNIILPYREEYDIRVNCNYGKNYGDFWRLSEYPHDVDAFDFEIVIYNEYGEKIASEKSVIELYDRNETDKPYNILFIGDSMTRAQTYIEQVSINLHNIVFKGSRNYFGHISHEGRGGWSYKSYFSNITDVFGGASPFLFPKNIDNYMGDIDFLKIANSENPPEYTHGGYKKHEFSEGCVYGKEGKLYTYKNGDFELLPENPEFEFDFSKYVKKNEIGEIDAVSILLGANDLQLTTYEASDAEIEKYISNTKRMIEEIHKYDKDIKIIVNLPVIGAEQYAWAKRMNWSLGSKQYRFNVIKAADALIKRFDGEKNIYISATLLNLDPVFGFDKEPYRANLYCDDYVMKQSNWVHPNANGYKQMGDALAAVIEAIRP